MHNSFVLNVLSFCYLAVYLGGSLLLYLADYLENLVKGLVTQRVQYHLGLLDGKVELYFYIFFHDILS